MTDNDAADREELSLSVRVRYGSATVELAGQLTATTGDLVFGVVEGELAESRDDLVLDLAGVSDCDADGARALVRAQNHAAAAGVSLILQGLPGPSAPAQPTMWFDDLLTRAARNHHRTR